MISFLESLFLTVQYSWWKKANTAMCVHVRKKERHRLGGRGEMITAAVCNVLFAMEGRQR